MEVAVLTTRLEAEVAAWQAKMATAIKTLNSLQKQMKDVDKATAATQAVLDSLGVDQAKILAGIADLKKLMGTVDDLGGAVATTGSLMGDMNFNATKVAADISMMKAETGAVKDLRDAILETRAAAFGGGWSIRGPKGFVSQAAARAVGWVPPYQPALMPGRTMGRFDFMGDPNLQRFRGVFQAPTQALMPGRQMGRFNFMADPWLGALSRSERVAAIMGEVAASHDRTFGRVNFLADPMLDRLRRSPIVAAAMRGGEDLPGFGRRSFINMAESPRFGRTNFLEGLTPGVAGGDLRRDMSGGQSAANAILAARFGEQKAFKMVENRMVNDLSVGGWLRMFGGASFANRIMQGFNASGLRDLISAGGGGGGRGIPLIGFGGGFGGRILGRRFGRGLPAFGSVLGLAGFGAEHLLTSGIGIAGSLGGGLLGGGLLAGGALGTAAVGMGTDLAGIGQAAGDIKKVSSDMSALSTAIKVYGRNSQEAATAQAQLNADLGSFSPVARGAVYSAAKTSQSFKTMFDQVTGQAEKIGAEIINQGMMVGKAFLPTIGKYAAQNMGIIQKQLQPFFAWLQKGGTGANAGGLGIFQNLEKVFQKNLPTSTHALEQAFELLAKVVDIAAQRTGGFVKTLNNLFTRLNSPSEFGNVSREVNRLITLFETWVGLAKAVGGVLFALFKPAVSFGEAFANELTKILDQFKTFLTLPSTQNALSGIFTAHLNEVIKGLGGVLEGLLPLVEQTILAFIKLSTLFSNLAAGSLKQIAATLKQIFSNPVVSAISGWVVAVVLANKAFFALLGLLGKVTAGLFGVGSAAGKSAGALALTNKEIATMAGLLRKASAGVELTDKQLVTLNGLLAKTNAGMLGVGGAAGTATGKMALFANSSSVAIRRVGVAIGGIRSALLGLAGKVFTIYLVASLLPQGKNVNNPLKNVPVANQIFGFGEYLQQAITGGPKSIPTASSAFSLLSHARKIHDIPNGYFLDGQITVEDVKKLRYNFASPFWYGLALMEAQQVERQNMARARALNAPIRYAKSMTELQHMGSFLKRPFERAIGTVLGGGLPVDIQTHLSMAGVGKYNQNLADRQAFDYYNQILKLPGLTRTQREEIMSLQSAYYVPPTGSTGAGAKPPGFGGPTSAGGRVFNLQQAAQQAMASGSGASTFQRVRDAKAYEAAAAAAFTHLKNEVVPATQLAAKQRELTVLARDESNARKMITEALAKQVTQNLQIVSAAVEQAKTNFDTNYQNAQSAQAQIVYANNYLVRLQKQEAVLEKQLAANKGNLAIQKELGRVRGDITKAEDQRRAALSHKAEDAILGLGGDTMSGSSPARIESRLRNNLLGLIRRLYKPIGGGRAGEITNPYAQFPGATTESIADLVKKMEKMGIKFPESSLRAIKEIEAEVLFATKHHTKIFADVNSKIIAILTQMNQTFKTITTYPKTERLETVADIEAGLHIHNPRLRKIIADRIQSGMYTNGMVPRVGAIGGIPIVNSGANRDPRFGLHGLPQHPLAGGVFHIHITVPPGAGSVRNTEYARVLAKTIRDELLQISRRNTTQTKGQNAGRKLGLT